MAERKAPPDSDLWRRVTADVEPLRPPRRRRRDPSAPVPSLPPPSPPLPAPDDTLRPPRRAAAPKPPTSRPPAPKAPLPTASARPRPPLALGAAVDVDARTVERLKRGRIAIEATLDLHGMTQAAAHGALERFLADGVAAGRRAVLVVTGRGGRGSEPGGVLRTAVPRWLNEPAFRGHVLAFATARPEHGGGGALYLLLKRAR